MYNVRRATGPILICAGNLIYLCQAGEVLLDLAHRFCPILAIYCKSNLAASFTSQSCPFHGS